MVGPPTMGDNRCETHSNVGLVHMLGTTFTYAEFSGTPMEYLPVTGDRQRMNVFKPAGIYFAIVFSAGFLLGVIRVSWLVPRLGARRAELIESPVMLLAVVLTAAWLNRHDAKKLGPATRLLIGFIAVSLVMLADLAVGVLARGMSLEEVFTNRDPVSGTAYYILLVLFMVMPAILPAGPVAKSPRPEPPSRRRMQWLRRAPQ